MTDDRFPSRMAVAIEHGFCDVPARIIGSLAVHPCDDVAGRYPVGAEVFRISHVGTGRAVTLPYDDLVTCLDAAMRLQAQCPELARIKGRVEMPREEVGALAWRAAAAVYPLELGFGPNGTIGARPDA